jgi:DNA repair protein RecO
MQQQIEAIILDLKPAHGGHALVTAFSPTQGLVKLWARGALASTSPRRALVQPLTRVELMLRAGREELHTLLDGQLLELFSVRDQLSVLTAALQMCQALLKSQQLERPAPALYQLLTRYLTQLPQLPPTVALASFRLKLLLHEGLLAPEELSPLVTSRSFEELKQLTISDEEEQRIAQLLDERIS